MAIFNVTIGAYGNLPPTRLGVRTIKVLFGNVYTFLLTDFTDTVPTYQDPEGDPPAIIKILSLPVSGGLLYNGIAVVLDQEINAANIGLLTFSTIINNSPSTTRSFYFDIADTGSNQFTNFLGGSGAGQINIKIGKDSNLPPSEVGDGEASIDYSETLVFTGAMFTTDTVPPYADPEGDPPSSIKILTLPFLGQIFYNGIPVVINQIISISDINLGLLTYVPDNADTDGDIQNFTFAVADTGSGQFVE